MGLLMFRAPATWWGIPNTVAYLFEPEFPENQTVFWWGKRWHGFTISHSSLQKDIKVLIEEPAHRLDASVEGYEYEVYPFEFGGRWYFNSKAQDMIVNSPTNWCRIDVIKPKETLMNAQNNIAFLHSYPHWQVITPLNFKPNGVLKNGSDYFIFEGLQFFLTIDELRRGVAVCVLYKMGAEDEMKTIISTNDLPAVIETKISVWGYCAITPTSFQFTPMSNAPNCYFLVETPNGFQWVANNPANAEGVQRPYIIRKALQLIAPLYTKSGLPVDCSVGSYRLRWGHYECELETYHPFTVGDFLLINADGHTFVYKVTSVTQDVEAESPPRYKVTGINPIDDDSSVVECEFAPSYLTVEMFLTIAKALCHFPNDIIFPNTLRNFYFLDDQRRTFKTLREYLDYLQMAVFQQEGVLQYFWDSNFNLVIAPPAGVAPPPNLPLLDYSVSTDFKTPTVVVLPDGTFFYNPVLLQQRGVIISQSQPAPATKEVSLTYLGFVYYNINQPVALDPDTVGYVSDIQWNADSAGNVTTNLKVVVYSA